jgi:hypothetical protein
MSRLFDDAASDQIVNGTVGVVSNEPITMAAWFRPDDDTVVGTLLSVGDGNQTDFWRIGYGGTTAGDPVFAQKQGNAGLTTETVVSSGGTTVNTWNHCAATFSSDTVRAVFLNGTKTNGAGTNVPDPGLTSTTSIGVRYNNAVPRHFSGRLAECAIWTVALSDDEVAALAKGLAPTCIRRQSLVFYAPLVRNIYDARGLTLSTSGTAVADHTRMFYPASTRVVAPAAAASPSLIPVIVHHLRQQGIL